MSAWALPGDPKGSKKSLKVLTENNGVIRAVGEYNSRVLALASTFFV